MNNKAVPAFPVGVTFKPSQNFHPPTGSFENKLTSDGEFIIG